MAAWEKFGPTFKDAIILMMLPICGDTNAMGVTLNKKHSKKLEELNNTIIASKSLKEASKASLIRYFDEGAGKERGVVEALLSYWLSWFILPVVSRWTQQFYVPIGNLPG